MGTATCGRLSRYAQTEHICDFTNCPVDSVWGTSNTAIYDYMGLEHPDAAATTTDTETTIDTETPDTNGSVDESSAASTTTTTTTTTMASIINVLVVLPTTVLVIGTAFL